MSDFYQGFYARIYTPSKKEGALLDGPDNLVGDRYDIIFKNKENEDGSTSSVAWIKNRFDQVIAYFTPEVSLKLRLAQAKGLELTAILSFVAYSDNADPCSYWGEVAIICYPKAYEEAFSKFVDAVSKKMADGIRLEVKLGDQAVEEIIKTNGNWEQTKTVPLPKKRNSSVILKSRQRSSEKLIEQGRKGNIGCYAISIAFIVAAAIVVIFLLHLAGLF